MKLYIDTSSNQKTIVKFGDRVLERRSKTWRSQVVLPMIKQICPDLTKITKIAVHPGPGSFTGLRVGAAIANALTFALPSSRI